MNQAFDRWKFRGSLAAYRMEIEAAGVASINAVRVQSATDVEVDYTYDARDGSGERRAGTLFLRENAGKMTGRFRTRADNGHVYEGTVVLSFGDDGTARGSYVFAGGSYALSIVRAP